MPTLLLMAVLLLLDQGTKWYVTQKLSVRQSIPVIKNVFHITYIRNPGAAFSILSHRPALLIVIATVVTIGLVVFFYSVPVEQKLLRLALTFAIAGALGNLIDRLRLGYVVDFLDFRVWPIFNVADIAIFMAIGLLVLDLARTPGGKGI
ncbi:MAG TPA: signal peptidase II [Oscillospiraceae bacterium]|nr:signal peptidase II [Oscillospiraceae bacterium]